MKNNDIQLRNDINVGLDDELMEETRYLIFFLSNRRESVDQNYIFQKKNF